jgi:site-specific DNA recombinase
MEQKSVLRCAVYTRKSSEEGLEQSFNSLDAQRESCEAFIMSQRQEGWRVIPEHYDDVGCSGGNMERPALKRLLRDVEVGKVNVIVVYKVDRLTRSLADFAKIVEALDTKRVSFVSVTQQFNTTSSMGRLTLNILLSFAQFEREVTGERIRDKIAASKKKGMWMGGQTPLGYDLQGRKLVPHTVESTLVRTIFTRYLELGCVITLASHLRKEGVKTKLWTTKRGEQRGGRGFAKGHLYYLLRNRLYIGEIRHREQWYTGEHEGIIPRELWDQVQASLDGNARTRRNELEKRGSSLLTGLIWDGEGNRLTPSFTVKRGRRYRYYVSQQVLNGTVDEPSVVSPGRFPAHELEARVLERVQTLLRSDAEIFDALGRDKTSPTAVHRILEGAKKVGAQLMSGSTKPRDLLTSFLRKVVVHNDHIELLIATKRLRELVFGDKPDGDKDGGNTPSVENDILSLTIEARRMKRDGIVHVVVPPSGTEVGRHPRAALVKAVVRGHAWHQRLLEGGQVDLKALAQQTGLTPTYVRNVLGFAFLAPDIVEAILEGRQPQALKFAQLYKGIPLSWIEQRRVFGFPSVDAQ